MLLSLLFSLTGGAATAATYLGCNCLSLWWLLPVFIGYYVAAVLVYIIWLFASILLTKPTDAPSEKLKKFYHWCEVHTLSWLTKQLFIRCKVSGAEKVPQEPFLFVCNHRSAFDPLATVALLKQIRFCFVCKPEVINVPVLGPAMTRAGFFPIDRENPRNAVTAIKYAAQVITEQKRSVGIYPEGTRSKSGEMLPFHAGSFKIAKLAGCPVVVASIQVKKGWLFPSKIELHVVDVMDVDYVKENNTATLAQRAETAIKEDLGV